MIRAEKFLISRPMYAFDPTSLRTTLGNQRSLRAVWFKRKSGILAANAGWYSLLARKPAPKSDDWRDWVTWADDNRYGATCQASYGGRLWTADSITITEATAWEELLAPMLAAYPNVPAGYDGWWTFPKPARAAATGEDADFHPCIEVRQAQKWVWTWTCREHPDWASGAGCTRDALLQWARKHTDAHHTVPAAATGEA